VPSGLGVSVAFDGTTFYYTNYGDPTLYGYTVGCVGTSCSTTLTLAHPIVRSTGGSVNVDAMAYDGARGILWAGGQDNRVYQLDPATGVATLAFSISACNPFALVDGLAYDGMEDVLYFSSDGSYAVCKYSTAGALLASIPTTSIPGFPSGCYNSGIAIGGDHLYLGSNGCGQILRVDKTTLGGGVLFASPGGRDEDMECDPVTFAPRSVIWSKDAYDNRVTAFEIENGTCGIGGFPSCDDVAPLAVDVTRPAAFTRYVDDVPSPSATETPLVLGDLTLSASTGNDAQVASGVWRLDGAPLAPAGPAPGYAATWAASLAAPGPHVLSFVAHDVQPGCVHSASRTVHVAQADAAARARSVSVAATHPVEATVQSPGADGDAGSGEHRFLDYAEPTLGLSVQALDDFAVTDAAGTSGHARSVISHVSLLGGRILAQTLRAEADARFDPASFSFDSSSAGSQVVGLVVDGTPVPVSAPNTVVDVPGVGRLVLLETRETTGGGHGEVRVTALHLYAAAEGFRGEVLLGDAAAGVALDGTPVATLGRDVDPADDAGTRGDVGSTPATARPLQAPALFAARLAPGDVADWYQVALKEGDKVVVVVKPAERVTARTGVATVPPTLAAFQVWDPEVDTDLSLVLRDPAGQVVLRSDAPLTAPERIELNADMDGNWTLGVLGDGGSTNYTLALSVTPIALVPDAPAGATCGDAAAPLLGEDRPVLDAFRGADKPQWFRLPASIGDDLTVTLHPLDADGADFDLYLYDRACRLLESSELGKSLLWDGDAPKGLPDATPALPSLYTGDYWVQVTRHVGVGNYLLVGQANPALPTLPGNDALTGADASDDRMQGTPLATPAGAWEGTWHEGDPRDAYTFHAEAGQRVVVAFHASAPNTGILELLDAAGNPVPAERGTQQGVAAFIQTFPLAASGDLTLVLTPTFGGGNYLFTVAVV
jgi:hypothetical protein